MTCVDTCKQLVVVLQVSILEEDYVVVTMGLYTILAEGVSALVACCLDLLLLVPRSLAIRDVGFARRRVGGHPRWGHHCEGGLPVLQRWCCRRFFSRFVDISRHLSRIRMLICQRAI